MPDTTVTFAMRVPVEAPNTRESGELANLLERWKGTRGVAQIEVEWQSLPQRPREDAAPLQAHVKIAVILTGARGAALRKLYSWLSKEAGAAPFSLAGRTCNLGDMFPD